MAVSEDLINFDLLEMHKENVQSLPGGRSARQLSTILSPIPAGRGRSSPTLDETKTLNDAIRQEYEIELQAINDSDDPLDIFDRYVKWTLNAYPSAQSTPQSQLLPLLERATKSFLTSAHYKNDPRYLKLWLHYIRLFSDSPRETFAFLARHNIGDGLSLFYEEFATWLESSSRWSQAAEVYTLGIEREARPAERLLRKYEQFQKRFEARTQNEKEPTSPALPTVRPALAAKIDPFASAPREEQQSSRPTTGAGSSSRSGKPKMAIFSDAANPSPPPTSTATSGWDSIGSIRDRKKENTIEAKPWTGETLKGGKRAGTGEKLAVFKDPNPRLHNPKEKITSKASTDVVNPRTGRAERVFVNVEAVYPSENEEFSFEELRAANRGWTGKIWKQKTGPLRNSPGNAQISPRRQNQSSNVDVENLSEELQSKAILSENSTQEISQPEAKPKKERRIKIREVKQETQTVKTRLESPTGKGKLRRKNSAEPTMTFHSKAATNEIYDLFNQPHEKNLDDTQSGDDTDFGDDGYSTAGESTGTGRISGNTTSEFDDTLANMSSQPDSVSPWSDFTASKHVPSVAGKGKTTKHKARQTSEDLTENFDSSQNQTQTSGFGSGFDTQAIAAIANQDFGDLDTKIIAAMAGDEGDVEDEVGMKTQDSTSEELKTPIEQPQLIEIQNKPRYVPLPPEDYEPTSIRPFRDPEQAQQSRLPFMTPIVEKTESSFGANTAFGKQQDFYDVTKTPSRGCVVDKDQQDTFESPSKLKLEQFLIGSPHQATPNSKRKGEEKQHTGASQLELLTSSPQKKKIRASPEKENGRDIDEPLIATTGHPIENTISVPQPVFETPALPGKVKSKVTAIKSPLETASPIVQDAQCNPVDDGIRRQILLSTSLTSYSGYHDHSDEKTQYYSTLKRYVEKIAANKIKSSPRKNGDKTIPAIPPILKFPGAERAYAVKRLLGKGAFAPVYLVETYESSNSSSCDHNEDGSDVAPTDGHEEYYPRATLEALKTDSPPSNSIWEFHILRLLSSRLSKSTSPQMLKNIIMAHELHVFADEAFLLLSYHPQGTLLDLVNWTREDRVRSGKPSGDGLDETLAMFFTVNLLQTLQAMHDVGVLHGDLKGDNVLLDLGEAPLATPYPSIDSSSNAAETTTTTEPAAAWASKRLSLIDFGRGIDVRAFRPDASFIADWPADSHDCPEVRAQRPWKWQLDYFGLAGVVHVLLFGKDIAVVEGAAGSGVGTDGIGVGGGLLGGIGKTHKLKEPLKRYWQCELWGRLFHLLVNSAVVSREEGGAAGGDNVGNAGAGDGRIRSQLDDITVKMQAFLAAEGERRDLRGAIKRAERLVAEKERERDKAKTKK